MPVAIKQILAMLLVAAVLGGCKSALEPVRYGGTTTITTSQTATIRLIPSVEPGDKSWLESHPVDAAQFFSGNDQLMFARSLGKELNRLKMLNVVDVGVNPSARSDLAIMIVFVRTYRRQFLFDSPWVEIGMEIRGESNSLIKNYTLDVFDSTAEGFSISPAMAKARTAERLMEMLMSDIDDWLASTTDPA